MGLHGKENKNIHYFKLAKCFSTEGTANGYQTI
jgi:hypothetical protein